MALDKKKFGRRLRVARESVGLTQGDVADKLGICRPAMVRIEQGKRSLAVHEFAIMLTLYKRQAGDFFAKKFVVEF